MIDVSVVTDLGLVVVLVGIYYRLGQIQAVIRSPRTVV